MASTWDARSARALAGVIMCVIIINNNNNDNNNNNKLFCMTIKTVLQLRWADLEGGRGAPPFFLGCFFKKSFEANNFLSGIVQSPQGCSCGVGLERCCALDKSFSAPSF